MEITARKKVGIIRGGTGGYYGPSLREGGDLILYIMDHLNDMWQPIDIFIDRDEVWHAQGIPIKPAELLQKVDVVLDTTRSNASTTLELLDIPRVGSKSFFTVLERHRPLLEQHMQSIGVKMPRSIILPYYQADIDGPKDEYAMKKAQEVFQKFTSPWIVRSFPPDADMGIHVAKTFPELVKAILDGIEHKGSILIEELISGKIASMHSVVNFRGKDMYTFPLIEVRNGSVSTETNFSNEEKEILSDTVTNIYEHFTPTHYLNSNFVLNPNRGIFLTSLLFSPNFRDPHFAYSCEAVGLKPHEVFDYMLARAL